MPIAKPFHSDKPALSGQNLEQLVDITLNLTQNFVSIH